MDTAGKLLTEIQMAITIDPTGDDDTPWWRVNLCATCCIDKVVLYNRDGFEFRLNNVKVELLDSSKLFVDSDQHNVGTEGSIGSTWETKAFNKEASYVNVSIPGRFEFLQLAEVVVVPCSGTECRDFTACSLSPAPACTSYSEALKFNNLAFCMETSQSSVGWEGHSWKAVDGNPDPVYYSSNSVTHTLYDNPAWWRVNLCATCCIDKVVLYNRNEYPDRLNGVKVELLNSSEALVDSDQHTGSPSSPVTWETKAFNKEASYVNVSLPGPTWLQLAEVVVVPCAGTECRDFTACSFSPAAACAGYSNTPSCVRSANPSLAPSPTPSSEPSLAPSSTPSSAPSQAPSSEPSSTPSLTPSSAPSSMPSLAPSSNPSSAPSSTPSLAPSFTPSTGPSLTPSSDPSSAPSAAPSSAPSSMPSLAPSCDPSSAPSSTPSVAPSSAPSVTPSSAPSSAPSSSSAPSAAPTKASKKKKGDKTSDAAPTAAPTDMKIKPDTIGSAPSSAPSAAPTKASKKKISDAAPTSAPTEAKIKPDTIDSTPSSAPSAAPTKAMETKTKRRGRERVLKRKLKIMNL